MDKVIRMTMCQTFDRRPLAIVHNLPGGDAEMYPAEMRALAAALLAAADECEARPMDRRRFLLAERSYDLTQVGKQG